MSYFGSLEALRRSRSMRIREFANSARTDRRKNSNAIVRKLANGDRIGVRSRVIDASWLLFERLMSASHEIHKRDSE